MPLKPYTPDSREYQETLAAAAASLIAPFHRELNLAQEDLDSLLFSPGLSKVTRHTKGERAQIAALQAAKRAEIEARVTELTGRLKEWRESKQCREARLNAILQVAEARGYTPTPEDEPILTGLASLDARAAISPRRFLDAPEDLLDVAWEACRIMGECAMQPLPPEVLTAHPNCPVRVLEEIMRRREIRFQNHAAHNAALNNPKLPAETVFQWAIQSPKGTDGIEAALRVCHRFSKEQCEELARKALATGEDMEFHAVSLAVESPLVDQPVAEALMRHLVSDADSKHRPRLSRLAEECSVARLEAFAKDMKFTEGFPAALALVLTKALMLRGEEFSNAGVIAIGAGAGASFRGAADQVFAHCAQRLTGTHTFPHGAITGTIEQFPSFPEPEGTASVVGICTSASGTTLRIETRSPANGSITDAFDATLTFTRGKIPFLTRTDGTGTLAFPLSNMADTLRTISPLLEVEKETVSQLALF